jgi:hypothetical protein
MGYTWGRIGFLGTFLVTHFGLNSQAKGGFFGRQLYKSFDDLRFLGYFVVNKKSTRNKRFAHFPCVLSWV